MTITTIRFCDEYLSSCEVEPGYTIEGSGATVAESIADCTARVNEYLADLAAERDEVLRRMGLL